MLLVIQRFKKVLISDAVNYYLLLFLELSYKIVWCRLFVLFLVFLPAN